MKILEVDKLSEKQLKKVDEFILSERTNGEFINTIEYLSYHKNKFIEDSIIVWDEKSGNVLGVLLATVDKEEQKIISHVGTTFAGPILEQKRNIHEKEEVLNIMLEYYEKRYKGIELRLVPSIYSFQPDYTIDYFLLKREYTYGMKALANVINISLVNDEQDVLQLFNANRRNHVKKAIKENKFHFKMKNEIDRKVWENMNQNLQEKFNSKTTHTYEEIEELQKKFPKQILPFYTYTKDEKYGAFALVFCFKNVFHTQYLDVNYELSNSYPNLLLIYNLIMYARHIGYDKFSFGASTEDNGKVLNYGLYNYKAGYGGGNIILPKFER